MEFIGAIEDLIESKTKRAVVVKLAREGAAINPTWAQHAVPLMEPVRPFLGVEDPAVVESADTELNETPSAASA